MNSIQQYHGQTLAHENIRRNVQPVDQNDSAQSLVVPILKRWRIVVLTFLSISTIGIPAIWYLVKPIYQATAAVRISPVISSILFGGEEGLPMYKNFLFTQADLMTSDKVLQRVADDLADKNLTFFGGTGQNNIDLNQKPAEQEDAMTVLKNALIGGTVAVAPEDDTELIKITMKSANPKELAAIVNAFVRAYMGVVVTEESKEGDNKLTILEDERKVLADKIERQKQMIHEMSQEYGTDVLSKRQEIGMQRVASLQAKLTEFEMEKIALNVQIQLLEKGGSKSLAPEELLRLRYSFVNSDIMVQNLTSNITQLEQANIIAKQTFAPKNPELLRRTELLEAIQQRLENRREEVGKNFDDMVAKEFNKNDENQLKNAKEKLKQLEIYEKHLNEKLAQEDTGTIELGRKQLAIQDFDDQLKTTKEMHETVKRRIQELEMERKRPARISVAYYASTAFLQDKRMKYTAALLFGAVAMGMMLALLKDRADVSLNTPEDITKRTGMPIIGTTTRSNTIKKSLIPRQIADDCQTICANLGLFNDGGMPKKIVITSPGPKEGKTTLAINMAANLAKNGRKVLLIDGDLRRPAISRFLKLTGRLNGLIELFRGKNADELFCSTSIPNLFVLASNVCAPSDIHKYLSQRYTGQIIDAAGDDFDHIIIDTPPVLAFPDALLWAKITDSVVVLTTFSGKTEGPDLLKTLERFAMIHVKVLGTILNNVPLSYSYNHYGYGYYSGNSTIKETDKRNAKEAVLMPDDAANRQPATK